MGGLGVWSMLRREFGGGRMAGDVEEGPGARLEGCGSESPIRCDTRWA